MAETKSSSLVAVIMGSTSDWETMSACVKTLDELGIPNEAHVLSAHRTPDATADFVRKAADRGIRVIIAAAGGAAHLAGVASAYTWLPVLGVPMQSQSLHGLDSLLSMAQMPGGIPVGTLAIGSAGAKNAALLAAAILATSNEQIRQSYQAFRKSRPTRCSRNGCRSENRDFGRPRRSGCYCCKGEIVALPTETAYGLAADALNPEAVAKIFEAKERPRFDPLIVHLPDSDWFEQVVDLSTQDRQLVLKLIDRFWPGPFFYRRPTEKTNHSRNCHGRAGHGHGSNQCTRFWRRYPRVWKTARGAECKSTWQDQSDDG